MRLATTPSTNCHEARHMNGPSFEALAVLVMREHA